jgi:hypothetical protein
LAAAGIGLILHAAEDVPLTGKWRGESVCTTSTASCHNETVEYYIAGVPGHQDLVTIRADKIVDGKAVTMGTGQWTIDRASRTLEWRTPERVWLLVVNGNRIEGTLTLADKTVFRKMSLKKDE